MISFLYSYNDPATDLILNMINPLVLSGAIVGGALPFIFSGMLIEAVAKAARKMVDEVRRQFREIPGILTGKTPPDYKTCIGISSKGAISEMKVPALLAIVVPVAAGFHLWTGICGWPAHRLHHLCHHDRHLYRQCRRRLGQRQKVLESGAIKGHGKGSPAHEPL